MFSLLTSCELWKENSTETFYKYTEHLTHTKTNQ